MKFIAIGTGCLGLLAWSTRAAEIPKEPVPKSPYIAVVYRYAEAMLEHGRDTVGPQKSGLFLSALDRESLAPLTKRPPAPTGVAEEARAGAPAGALVGANPQHDENLLRLLFTVSELSSKPTYRQAAEAALKWFLENAASPATHLLPWGQRMAWDVIEDKPISSDPSGSERHVVMRPWMLWDQCFDLAPEPSRHFALALAGLQSADGALPSHPGFYLRTWAVAYAHTKDQKFLEAITLLSQRYENRRREGTGLIATGPPMGRLSGVATTLSLAIDCDGAAHRVPEPLASRLRAFAAREDANFCGLPHDLKGSGGFITSADLASGKPQGRRTPLWDPRSGRRTTAQVAMMCVSRYDNNGDPAYRELIHAAADAYLNSMPAEGEDVWPGTLGQAISLELAAWRSTARQAYFNRARELGDFALAKFFDKGPLPRASLKSDHYESITGADTLALALTELHLHVLHITAVRCPPNTIDR